MGKLLSTLERSGRFKPIVHDGGALQVGPAVSDVVRVEEQEPQHPQHSVDGEHPWWLVNPPLRSAGVDALVVEALRYLDSQDGQGREEQELFSGAVEDHILRSAINSALQKLTKRLRFSGKEVDTAYEELVSLFQGTGPLAPLLEDALITDIFVDSHSEIRCLRKGKALDTPFRFRNAEEFNLFVRLICVRSRVPFDEPVVEFSLRDKYGTRVSLVHQALREANEPGLVLRIPRLPQASLFELIKRKTLAPQTARWLGEVVASGEANILIVGASATGKTTLAAALLGQVRSDERVCVIEDIPELPANGQLLERLLTKPRSSELGAVKPDTLLRAALRRAPHRIVFGEIRDIEAPVFLKAVETGHGGAIATLHAGTAEKGLWRLVDILREYIHSDESGLLKRISKSVDLVITMAQRDESPIITGIFEVKELDTGATTEFNLTELLGVSRVEGERKWSCSVEDSRWIKLMKERGVGLPV